MPKFLNRFFLLIAMLAVAAPLLATAPAKKMKEAPVAVKSWSLVIHGGAGVLERASMTPEKDAAVRAALARSLDAGSAKLAMGGSAMDAVAAAIMVLEDDPNFNAGRGAVFTYEGENELDASIMDGKSRAAGAATGIRFTKNPILLARAVMEKSPHVLLSREGADQFSREQGLEQVDPSWFATPERLKQLEKMKEKKLGWYDVDLKYGTVGAVAVDSEGNVAAGTSTGGLTGKRWGRIGDSPIIGAGNYADNRACGVSATGSGEYFIRLGVAHEICARMRFKGEDAKTAADHVMKEVSELGGSGGVIVSAPDGTTTWSFTTPGMYRGKANSQGEKLVAVYGDEE